MELKRLLTRATALLLQGAYQGAESFIEQAMAEADKLKQEFAELDTLRTRVTEMALEIERLQSVIDEANAQEPAYYEVENMLHGDKDGAEKSAESMSKYRGHEVKANPLFASPIHAQHTVDRQAIIDVLLASGNLSEGVTADLIIGAIGAQPQHTVFIGRDEWRSEAQEQQSPAVAAPEFNGWYCAQCQCGVDPSEVTYHETHTACGRYITDDVPPTSPRITDQDKRAVSGFRWRKKGNEIWDYVFDRAPDSWELREAEIEWVQVTTAQPAQAAAIPERWHENEFIGTAPTGYKDWNEWMLSPVKLFARIEAREETFLRPE